MKDKEKQIEELEKTLYDYRFSYDDCVAGSETNLAKFIVNQGFRKLPEDSVVIPKEISWIENIEKRVRTFRLDGNDVDFSQEQIMALAQIFHFKEKQENEIRKETAREILNEVGRVCGDYQWFKNLCKQYGLK